ncbi:glycosyltransferase family 4 protein [Hymenobacter persicinus]|uniref:Glycosyltransferase family 1 protein n=1 Tax=Hymenobacter persicinus TaxID=2025506 RepID=A0A4Q5LE45_9BACT|nr:glycosyltransferase family 4 protein [Hymenobacter persicinus]RYU82199.1 glycosyltransferase family 1 protein [Hymenobacter persicinus]
MTGPSASLPPPVAGPPFSAAAALRLGVLCLSASLGGLELNSLKFADWMRQRGHHVVFFAPPATPLAELAGQWGVPLQTLTARRGLGVASAAQQLKAQLAQHQLDTLVVTQNKDLNLVTLTKLLLGGRLRILYQQHMQLGLAKRDLFHTLRFRLVDAWLSPLPGLVRQVSEQTRYDARRVHLVPLGLPLEQFAPPATPKAEFRRALELPTEGILLGILGRLDDGKGQEFVIQVLDRLRSTSTLDVSLLIMGDITLNEGDAYLQHLRRLVAQLGLEQHVHFRQFRPDPAVFYHAVDVFVLASVNETYGMVTLEAMAAQVPIVAAATGGTLELVEHEKTALLYPLLDVEACTQCIRRCLQDPAATRQRVLNAYAHVQNYSHQRQCQLTEEVIQTL